MCASVGVGASAGAKGTADAKEAETERLKAEIARIEEAMEKKRAAEIERIKAQIEQAKGGGSISQNLGLGDTTATSATSATSWSLYRPFHTVAAAPLPTGVSYLTTLPFLR